MPPELKLTLGEVAAKQKEQDETSTRGSITAHNSAIERVRAATNAEAEQQRRQYHQPAML